MLVDMFHYAGRVTATAADEGDITGRSGGVTAEVQQSHRRSLVCPAGGKQDVQKRAGSKVETAGSWNKSRVSTGNSTFKELRGWMPKQIHHQRHGTKR